MGLYRQSPSRCDLKDCQRPLASGMRAGPPAACARRQRAAASQIKSATSIQSMRFALIMLFGHSLRSAAFLAAAKAGGSTPRASMLCPSAMTCLVARAVLQQRHRHAVRPGIRHLLLRI